MKIGVVWKDGMEFDGVAADHIVHMDAKSPIGRGSGATPKELVAMGLGGCTAMDVVALLKKYRQPVKALNIKVDIETSTGSHPSVFTKAILTFEVEGEVAVEKLLEAVRLSQTKFCGVSAMLAKALPIEYRINLNGSEIGIGAANFEKELEAKI